MMRRSIIGVVVALALLSTAVVVMGQSSKAFLGTWKLNLQKSRFSPGPAPTSQVRRYELRPDGFVAYTQAGLDAQGNPVFTATTMKMDGKDYRTDNQTTLPDFQIAGAKPGTVAVRLVDANTVVVTGKDGKGVPGVSSTDTVSKDGKTLTRITKGTNAQGQAVDNLLVFDKQ